MKKCHPIGSIAGKLSEKKALKGFQEIRNPGELRGCMTFDHQLHSRVPSARRRRVCGCPALAKSKVHMCPAALGLLGMKDLAAALKLHPDLFQNAGGRVRPRP